MEPSDSHSTTPLAVGKTIVLVGLMGAGKSTIGKRLSKALGLTFRDSDAAITEAAGCSIPDIFQIHGEDIFRDLEKRVIINLLQNNPPFVMATGGGAFMNPAIRDVIAEKAISIWLRADVDVLVERVSRRNNRPLLEKGDKRDILSKLIEERYPVYAEADIAIDSDEGPHESVVDIIIGELKKHIESQ